MKFRTRPLALAVLLATVALPAFAADDTRLTGDWGGARTSMENFGITTEASYTLDLVSNVSGGISTGNRGVDLLDVAFLLDGEKLFGAQGLSATVQFINSFGGQPDTALVGSGQGINSNEAPNDTAKLFQAFIQQNFYNDRLSILAGLYDSNSEFYSIDTAGLFIHPAITTGTDYGQSGRNGPSVFPFTSVGARVKVLPTESTYAQFAVLDGVPGDLNRTHGTHIDFDENDGALIVGEVGYTPEGAKIGVGAWLYTEDLDHQSRVDGNGNALKERSSGVYVITEKKLYTEEGEQGLSGFLQGGVASEEVNQFDYAFNGGLVYTGLFPSRDDGKMGIAFTHAHNGDSYRDAQVAAATPADSAETTFELTYSDNITPWLTIQPDVQYIMNPGTVKNRDNATVFTTRLGITF